MFQTWLLYLTGLSLMFMALVAWLAPWPLSKRARICFSLAAAQLGLGLWCEVFADRFGAEQVGHLLRFVLWTTSFATLCEASHQLGGPSRRWLLARRGWFLLPIVIILATTVGSAYADILLRAALAWEGGLLAARALGLKIRRLGIRQERLTLLLLAAGTILSGGLAAQSAAITACSATLIYGVLAHTAIRRCQGRQRIGSWAGVLTFILLAALGSVRGTTAGEATPKNLASNESSVASDAELVVDAAPVKSNAKTITVRTNVGPTSSSPQSKAQATALWAVFGLLAFVAIIWAISKLPFVH